jgi:protein-histidine pros-kinase
VEISLSPQETEEGTLESSAIRDITERKKAELSMRRHIEDLQRRTHELDATNKEPEAIAPA